MKNGWLTICVLLGSGCLLYGQQPLILSETFFRDSLNQWYALTPLLSVQKDLPESVGIKELAGTSPDWIPLTDLQDRLWQQNCWLRLDLKNPQEKTLNFVLLVHADLITSWSSTNGTAWLVQYAGNLRPRSQWDSRQHQPVFSSPHTLQLTIPANSSQQILLKLGPPDQQMELTPMLCNRNFFLAYSVPYFNRTFITQSLVHGALWILLLYHLLMFALNRKRVYLYYSGYLMFLSWMLFYAFGMQYLSLPAEFPYLSRWLQIGSIYALMICYSQFSNHFLHREEWRKDLQRLLKWFAYLCAGVGIISLLLLLLPVTIFPLRYSYWLLLPVSIIGLTGFLYINWQYWRSSKPLARYLAATNGFLLTGFIAITVIHYAGTIGWIPFLTSSFWGILFLEVMLLFQVLSFALVLTYQNLETERERTRLKELDQLKARFFATISHEFRTPLTLILGPLQQLKARINQAESRRYLRTAESYAKKLLSLVNQILALTKLEAGKLEVHPQVFDIVGQVKVITYSFESVAGEQNIRLSFWSSIPKLDVWLDPEKIEQILINLIANALKYNEEGGEVEVQLSLSDQDVLHITIRDTGIGIPEADLPHIFQMYYQANTAEKSPRTSSSGIGLALTKELTKLHKGSIRVESTEGEGTLFELQFPLPPLPHHQESKSTGLLTEFPEVLPPPEILDTESGTQPLVLLVEDHPDIRDFIQSCLQDNYQLVFAKDGVEGLTVAQKEVPDLIITDVMMPKMDGFALTKALKEQTSTSHIPILILTGKSSPDSRIEGLQTQADDYLTKPFNPEELQLRIHNLLENRRKWVTHYQQQHPSEQPDRPLSMEEVFLQKARTAVEEHLSDENFSVEQLGRALQLDRTQLFRKLKALTDQNPSGFIRTIRLETAYKLLQNRTATVAEIAFAVGFSNTSYFNRSFKTHFGKTPGEVLRQE